MDTMCVDAATIRSATAVADARETTRAFLEALRQPAVDSEVADTAVLVLSELITNAVGPWWSFTQRSHVPGIAGHQHNPIADKPDRKQPPVHRCRDAAPNDHQGPTGPWWSFAECAVGLSVCEMIVVRPVSACLRSRGWGQDDDGAAAVA
jgi:hypothetical protein